ncbi:MAG TPA: helix-hairpin-helix domain-containing protein [Patescibacteria group bacterium]|nr:helix-hairpin-helix domain-containing protein [Patescibacteria group bacterium]
MLKDEDGLTDGDGYMEFEDKDTDSKKTSFDFEKFINKYKVPLAIFLLGLTLTGLGIFFLKNDSPTGRQKIEVLSTATESQKTENKIVVEIAGAVKKPGVYTFENSDVRIIDLISVSGGFSDDADTVWIDKVVNKAAKLSDGAKYYIKSVNDMDTPGPGKQIEEESANNLDIYQSESPVFGGSNEGLTNINTASIDELDKLPGIGPVYGKSIVEHRPYSDINELVTKSALKQYVFDKIKELVTVN